MGGVDFLEVGGDGGLGFLSLLENLSAPSGSLNFFPHSAMSSWKIKKLYRFQNVVAVFLIRLQNILECYILISEHLSWLDVINKESRHLQMWQPRWKFWKTGSVFADLGWDINGSESLKIDFKDWMWLDLYLRSAKVKVSASLKKKLLNLCGTYHSFPSKN